MLASTHMQQLGRREDIFSLSFPTSLPTPSRYRVRDWASDGSSFHFLSLRAHGRGSPRLQFPHLRSMHCLDTTPVRMGLRV